jgi:hypothetical protein
MGESAVLLAIPNENYKKNIQFRPKILACPISGLEFEIDNEKSLN